jgi:hypothetical protein
MGLLPLVFLGAMAFVNSDEHSRSIIPLPDASPAITRPGPGRVLFEMVGDTLALARREPLFKIGEHEWCDPDYQQILLWAEALALAPEEVIWRLLDEVNMFWAWMPGQKRWHDLSGDKVVEASIRDLVKTVFRDGRLMRLYWALDLLPLSVVSWVEGLEIENFRIANGINSDRIPMLSLLLPKLRRLDCGKSGIEALDLSHVPSLEELFCWENHLSTIDLSKVPRLESLHCNGNKLKELDLSKLPLLKELDCCENAIGAIDLSTTPRLESLDCSNNKLTEIDFSGVPELTNLDCHNNAIAILDIRQLPNLERLKYDAERTRLVPCVTGSPKLSVYGADGEKIERV